MHQARTRKHLLNLTARLTSLAPSWHNVYEWRNNKLKALSFHRPKNYILIRQETMAMEENDPKRFRFVEEAEDEIVEKINELKRAVRDAVDEGDKHTEALCLSYIGLAYYKLGNYDSSQIYHEKHLALARERKDESGERRALCNLGCVFKITGNIITAKELLEEALEIAKERKDTRALGKIYNNLGNIYEMEMNFDKALKCYLDRLGIAKELGDQNGIGKACANIGNLYHVMGNLKKSIAYYQEMLAVLREKLRIQDVLPDDQSDSDDDDIVDIDAVAMEAVNEMRLKMEEDRVRKEQEELGTVKKGLHLAKLFRRKAPKKKEKEGNT